MTRITNSMRDAIRTNLLIHTFGARHKAIFEEHAKIANKLYEIIFTIKDRKLMTDLPKGWLSSCGYIAVKSGDFYNHWCFNGGAGYNYHRNVNLIIFRDYEKFNNKDKLFPYSKINSTFMIEPNSPLGKEMHQWKSDCDDFITELSERSKIATATLAKFYTIEKLIEAWPEVEQFVPEKEKPVQLPALNTKTLNEMFALKK